MSTTDSRGPRFHEASHFVTGVYCGATPVYLLAHAKGGTAVMFSEDPDDAATIAVAGEIGASMAGCDCPDSTRMSAGDLAQFAMATDPAAARARAAGILRRHWPEVRRLAAGLASEGVMDADRAREVMATERRLLVIVQI